eukprot:10149920-Heterocapsa_arctica.AAC.1
MAVPVLLITASWTPGGTAPSASLEVMRKEAPNSHSAGLASTCAGSLRASGPGLEASPRRCP